MQYVLLDIFTDTVFISAKRKNMKYCIAKNAVLFCMFNFFDNIVLYCPLVWTPDIKLFMVFVHSGVENILLYQLGTLDV